MVGLCYPWLEERGVEVLVVSVVEEDGRFAPDDFVGEGHPNAVRQFDLVLGGERDVDDLLSVVSDFELLVRPEKVLRVFVLLAHFAHDSPDGQVVDVHLVPVMMLHRVDQLVQFLLVQ